MHAKTHTHTELSSHEKNQVKEINLKKGYILYDSNYMTFRKGKTVETVKDSGCQVRQREGQIGRAQRVL
jgi:hypothetical protein